MDTPEHICHRLGISYEGNPYEALENEILRLRREAEATRSPGHLRRIIEAALRVGGNYSGLSQGLEAVKDVSDENWEDFIQSCVKAAQSIKPTLG